MSELKFKPLDDRILVEPDPADDKTAAGIIIPDGAKQKPNMGTIRAIGTVPIDVVVGDKVLYGKYSGTEVNIDGVDYLLMRQSDVLGIV